MQLIHRNFYLAKIDCEVDSDTITEYNSSNAEFRVEGLKVEEVSGYVNGKGQTISFDDPGNLLNEDIGTKTDNKTEDEVYKKRELYVFNEEKNECSYNGNNAEFKFTGNVEAETNIYNTYSVSTSVGYASCLLSKQEQLSTASLTCSVPPNKDKTT